MPRKASILTSAILIDRMNAAIEHGILDIQWELLPTPEDTISITDGELARLWMILFPNDFPDRPPRPQPTTAPPGSRSKIATMQARVAAGLSVCDPRDATMNNRIPITRTGQGQRNDWIDFDHDD